jgi:hypothetical protein
MLFPVDTVKLIVQTGTGTDSAGFSATFAQVLRDRGVIGLYKGLSASLFKESIHSFNYWLFHGLLFKGLTKNDDTSKTSTGTRLLLNLLAKQLNWLCTVPFEVISSVNQLSLDSPGFYATAVRLYSRGGLGAFYRGLAVSLVLAINPAIMNTLITTFLRCAAAWKMTFNGSDYEDARDHGSGIIGFVTALSKLVATLATYPLIRAKVLQQTINSRRQASVMSVWREIIETEGARGLYRGLIPMTYKTLLWNSIMMVFKHLLGPKRMITPPATPIGARAARLAAAVPLPLMAREPFPAELLTSAKLDEILNYLKHGKEGQTTNRKVDILESRVEELATDLKEITAMLQQLVHCRGASPDL